MNSQTTFSTSHDQITPSLKSQKKSRGKINIVACDRCKRDKKKCDGNYLTRKPCKYCHNHNETCVYSEPNLLRITRILNAARKNAVAGEEREDDPEQSRQELEEQMTKYENTIISLMNQINHKNETKTIDLIGNLYLSLFSNPHISNEQTIILKKLCEITNNVNTNIDNENLNKILNKLLILTSNDSTEFEKGQSWEELENFVIHNNLIIPIPLTATNFFGFSYPSGSTTPIPSPQFLNNDQFQSNDYKPNVMTTSKKRKIEHIAIRPSKKENNVIVWHRNDPCEEVPMIAVHAPQNIHSIDNEIVQSPDISFDNIDNISNENLQFSTLLSSQESYGLDEVSLDEIEQFSNVTSPTFSSSDDNMEFPTYLSNPPVDLFYFSNSTTLTTFDENY
jgi:hypothetical protein